MRTHPEVSDNEFGGLVDDDAHRWTRNLVRGGHHLEGGRPEPAVDLDGLEPGLIAALDLAVAQASGGVHVRDAAGFHEVVDEVLLLLGLQADHVHAHFPAVVAAGEPVPPGVPQERIAAGKGYPVVLVVEREVPACKNGNNHHHDGPVNYAIN